MSAPDHGLDTNVLLRIADKNSPDRPIAQAAVEQLLSQGASLFICFQNLVEFWSVATRPAEARGGLGLTSAEAANELNGIRAAYDLAPDSASVYAIWESFVANIPISGIRAHDARLAATFLASGVTHILTFDDGDFAGFPGITAVNPRSVLPTTTNG